MVAFTSTENELRLHRLNSQSQKVLSILLQIGTAIACSYDFECHAGLLVAAQVIWVSERSNCQGILFFVRIPKRNRASHLGDKIWNHGVSKTKKGRSIKST